MGGLDAATGRSWAGTRCNMGGLLPRGLRGWSVVWFSFLSLVQVPESREELLGVYSVASDALAFALVFCVAILSFLILLYPAP